MFPNTYVKIERMIETGAFSDVGTPVKSLTTVSESIYVSLLEDTAYKLKNVTDYSEVGQTTLTMYKLTCNTFFDFEAKDIITVLSVDNNKNDLDIGAKLKIASKPYRGTLIPHIHATLKLGVA